MISESTKVRMMVALGGNAILKHTENGTVEEAKELAAEGQFARGSMAPKVESTIRFIESGGKKVIITSIGNASQSLGGEGGTVITKSILSEVN